MNVIFLDFDGVLVNRNSLLSYSGKNAKVDPTCVAALNRVLSATGAKIVVSSTWRMDGLAKCRQHLKKWGVEGEVIGTTPDLTRRPEDSRIWVNVERGMEIADFLARHPKIERYVIIDDDSDMAHLKHRHIKTSFELGLTEEDADRAIKLMLENLCQHGITGECEECYLIAKQKLDTQ